MKVAIIGGGPAGLYLALLLKRSAPDWQVEIIEQNSADATFGFGVVLADTGLQQLRDADAASYEALVGAMQLHDRQIITQGETPIEITLPVKGGAIPRLKLLQTLEAQAKGAGVVIHHQQRISGSADLARFGLQDADVVVGADGANSTIRLEFAEQFGTTTRTLQNHFAWFGTPRVFESSALVFRKYQGGHFVAHYYAYSDEMSTFVAECDDVTWHRLGLEQMSDEQRQALFEHIFAPELDGAPLISGNAKSVWRQFPAIRNARWTTDRYVLIGDALASAHFSIGSGTRIAMNDSIALAKALLACKGDALKGLQSFEHDHGPKKHKLIDASELSYLWYEQIAQ
ncbi:FAD-dependent monooxygenase, partial [Pseudomonas sp.]|uniref:FAD-dependent monooxygenase n=1 Tax=Pseudomonas sp. TaxID=306 RepID=UPI002624C19F